MKRIKKVVTTFGLVIALLAGTLSANAGVIVNLADQRSDSKCGVANLESDSKVDYGVIVNLTGVIVNFTGVIVNFTGVIVNFADTKDSTCGHIPTSD